MAVNIAAFLASLEEKVSAAVATTDGLKAVQDLAPLFAELAVQLEGDFSDTAKKVYTAAEDGAVSIEQHAVLATKAVAAKLWMDATNIFSRVPAVPPTA